MSQGKFREERSSRDRFFSRKKGFGWKEKSAIYISEDVKKINFFSFFFHCKPIVFISNVYLTVLNTNEVIVADICLAFSD